MIKQVDVIIPTNKNLIKLKNLIYQINRQKGNFKINIYLIHQTLTPEMIPSFLLQKNIHYQKIILQNLSNAKNQGLKLSKSRIVTILDDDIIISENYFAEAIKIFMKEKLDILFFRINKFKSNIPLTINMKNFDHNINYKNSSCCLSSAMWINKKKKFEIEFDNNFGLGAKYGSADETDFIFRALNINKRIRYISKSFVYHPWEFDDLKSSKSIYKKFFSYGVGQGALYKKHLKKNRIYFFYLLLYSIIKSFIGVIIYSFILKKKNLIKYSAMFFGKIAGFKNYK